MIHLLCVLFHAVWITTAVHDRRSEEVLQRNEEARLKTAAKTHTKTEGRFERG